MANTLRHNTNPVITHRCLYCPLLISCSNCRHSILQSSMSLRIEAANFSWVSASSVDPAATSFAEGTTFSIFWKHSGDCCFYQIRGRFTFTFGLFFGLFLKSGENITLCGRICFGWRRDMICDWIYKTPLPYVLRVVNDEFVSAINIWWSLTALLIILVSLYCVRLLIVIHSNITQYILWLWRRERRRGGGRYVHTRLKQLPWVKQIRIKLLGAMFH